MPERSRRDATTTTLLWAIAAATPGILASLVRGRERRRRPPATVRVRSEGRVSATPDTAVVSMGVETREQAPAAAYGRSARLADALLQALRSAGVADADIRTAGVGLQPEYTAKPDAAPEITGWRASHTLTVRLHDIERVPDILERTVGILGADGRINSIHFGIEDSDALLMQARAAAFANARAAAERLAQAAGLRLATLLAAEDAGVVSPLPRATDARMMAMSADLGGEVMPGQIDVSASVVVEYALRR